MRPPLRDETFVSGTPRPEPLWLPPPVSLFTVAQARRSASFSGTPRSSYPASIWRAWRFCLSVYFALSPRGMTALLDFDGTFSNNERARAAFRAGMFCKVRWWNFGRRCALYEQSLRRHTVMKHIARWVLILMMGAAAAACSSHGERNGMERAGANAGRVVDDSVITGKVKAALV